MVDPSPRRKLAVILVTDVVGYSSMMEKMRIKLSKILKPAEILLKDWLTNIMEISSTLLETQFLRSFKVPSKR